MSNLLHIFNPDTDFALAAKSDFYTPPRKVLEFRNRSALFPATYAKPGDAILILPEAANAANFRDLPYYELVQKKDLQIIIQPETVSNKDFSNYVAAPWGWNRVIRRYLADNYPSLAGVPSEDGIERIKMLSHRRITIPFHQLTLDPISAGIPEPKEFFNAEDAMDFYHEHKDVFFKSPWSSSGRGVIRTNNLLDSHVNPWVSGAISNQGSVMGEIAQQRKLDFATEWCCQNGNVSFVGYSVFETSRRGKYKGNIDAAQSELLAMIQLAAPNFDESVIELQKNAIQTLIAKDYNGPLGVDMLATHDGKINMCVEINLRMTMGLCRLLNNTK